MILEVIQNITDSTNLSALNAAGAGTLSQMAEELLI